MKCDNCTQNRIVGLRYCDNCVTIIARLRMRQNKLNIAYVELQGAS